MDLDIEIIKEAGKEFLMKVETKILLLLSDKEALEKNLIVKILKISQKIPGEKTRSNLRKLETANAISCIKEKYQITGNGLKRLPRPKGKLDYSLSYWLKNWTMLIFEIPEKNKNKRDKLRYRLKKHNFGMIQSSIWISPRDIPSSINNFIIKANLTPLVQTLKFSVSKEDNYELISRAWKTNKLNQEYRQFVEQTKDQFNLVKEYNWKSNRVKRQVLKMLAEEAKETYHRLFKRDPKLPKTILPNDWQGFRAHHIYQQLFKYL